MNDQTRKAVRKEFQDAWESGQPPSIQDFLSHDDDLVEQYEDLLPVELAHRWRPSSNARPKPCLESYLRECPQLAERPEVLSSLLALEYRLRLERGERDILAEYLDTFPDMRERLAECLKREEQLWSRQASANSTFTFAGEETTDRIGDAPVEEDSGRKIVRPEMPVAGDATEAFEGDGDEKGSRPASDRSRDSHDEIELPQIPGYESQAYIARGGMGFVIRARHQVLDRLVAIKMPLPSAMEKPATRTRFMREARAAANLSHPQICPIHEVGEVDGQPFIVMRFIDGEPLDEWSNREQPNGRRAAELTSQLSRAIQYAHDHGVLHRDIKPANVMLDAESNLPVLMDFGLAKESGGLDSLETQAGQVMGTPSFMAPEQADGRIDDIGPRTDVYSLGALLYYLLCQRPPFEGSLGAVLRKVQTETPPAIREYAANVHRDLETICNKAMSKVPEDRYASAAEFADDLDRFTAGEAIVARPLSRWQKVGRSIKRRPLTWFGGTVAALMLVASAFVIQWVLQAAEKAATDRELTQLTAELESEVTSGDWGPEHLQTLDDMVDRLQQNWPEQGRQWQQRVSQGLVKSLERDLQRPRLDESILPELERKLQQVAKRNPSLHEHWRKQLDARIARWEEVFALTAESSDSELQNAMPNAFARDGELLRCLKAHALSAKKVQGRVEWEAELVGPWDEGRVGLSLGAAARDQDAYLIIVRRRPSIAAMTTGHSKPETAEPETAEPETTETIAYRQPAELVVLRGKAPIKRWLLNDSQLEDHLTLKVRREGEAFQIWLNSKHYRCVDLFPARHTEGTRFGILPGAMKVASLRAARLRTPLAASPLEQGDDRWVAGDVSGALAAYSAIDLSSLSESRRYEVQVKRGICLLESGQSQEAEALLSKTMLEPGRQWPIYAACRLWQHYLKSGQEEKSDQLIDLLKDRYPLGEMGATLPESLRADLIRQYKNVFETASFETDPKLLQQVERAAVVESMLGMLDEQKASMMLLQAYSRLGRLDEAVELGQRQAELGNAMAANEYMDVLCVLGDYEHALAEWERLPIPPETLHWQLSRARILGGLGRWSEVKRIVDEILTRDPLETAGFIRTALLDGAAFYHMGHHDLALKTWQAHLETARKAMTKRWESSGRITSIHFYYMILGGLAQDLANDEIDYFARGFAGTDLYKTAQTVIRGDAIYEAMHRGWGSDRGRDVAFRLILDQTPANERTTVALLAGGYGFLAPRLFGKTPPGPDQDTLLWETSQQLVDLMRTKQLKLPQMLLLMAALKGNTGFLGWGGVAHVLPNELRANLAYLLAQRAILTGDTAAIEPRLKEALQHAPDGSLASQLAGEDLKTVDTNHATLVIDNRTGEPWTLKLVDEKDDVHELEIPGASPDASTPTNKRPPSFTLPPGDYRVLPLPGAVVDATIKLPQRRRCLITLDDPPWRAAARRFVKLGGLVDVIWDDGGKKNLKAGEPIPVSSAARLQRIAASFLNTPITDADLAVLRHCTEIESFQVEGPQVYCSIWGLKHLRSSRFSLRQLTTSVPVDSDFNELLQDFPFLRSLSCTTSEVRTPDPPAAARLQSLALSPSQFRGWQEALVTYDGLTELAFYGTEDDDLALAGLRSLEKVRRLTVSSYLPARWLPPHVTRVKLGGDANSAAQIDEFQNVELDWLAVHGELTPESVKRLRQLRKVSTLSLHGRGNEAQAMELAELRSDWHVQWESKPVGEGRHRDIAKKVIEHGLVKLTTPDWVSCPRGGELPESPFTIVGVELSNIKDQDVVDRLLRELKGIPQLVTVGLSGCHFSPDTLTELLENSNVYYLGLRGSNATDEFLENFPSLPFLQGLDLRKTAITREAVSQMTDGPEHLMVAGDQFSLDVGKWRRLIRLTIERPTVETLRDAASLPLRELTVVGASDELITALDPLPESLKMLLMSYGQSPVTKDFLSKLPDTPNIRLDLMQMPLGDDWVEGIAAKQNITYLRMATEKTEAFHRDIQRLRQLRPDMIIHP